jgi:hypothetical protein
MTREGELRKERPRSLYQQRTIGCPILRPLSRISCYAAPFGTPCAAFIKESRMELVDLAIIDRKSGIRRRVGYHRSQSIERPFCHEAVREYAAIPPENGRP